MSACGRKGCKCEAVYREGDTPSWSGKAVDKETGQVIDLTNTDVTLHIIRDENYTDIVKKTAVINDPLSGEYVFNLSAGDLICGNCQEVLLRTVESGTNVTSSSSTFICVLRSPEP